MTRHQTRDRLTDNERQCLLDAVDRVCGARPAGTRMDADVASWKWAFNWILGMSERRLKKQAEPATHKQIDEVAASYAKAAFEKV